MGKKSTKRSLGWWIGFGLPRERVVCVGPSVHVETPEEQQRREAELAEWREDEVGILLEKARESNVQVNLERARQFALLRVAAVRQTYDPFGSRERARSAVHRQLEKRTNQSRAEILPSASRALAAVERCNRVLSERLQYLPELTEHLVSLETAIGALKNLRDATKPDPRPPHPPERSKAQYDDELDVNPLTLVWWYRFIPEYRNKWHDMHELACAWGVSRSQYRTNFQRDVTARAGRIVIRTGPPAWGLLNLYDISPLNP